MKFIIRLIQLLTCCMFIVSIAINKNQKILGFSLKNTPESEQNIRDEWNTDDGYRVITTRRIAKDVWGFGGNVPLNIYLKDNKIAKIELLENSENPEFLESFLQTGWLLQWDELTPDEALLKKVDAVSGATLSSSAIIKSVNKAMVYAGGNGKVEDNGNNIWKYSKTLIILLLVGCGMIIPLFYKGKRYRTIQLLLNVLILGLWSGTFISLSALINFFSNGINAAIYIAPLLLLLAAFIYPLFGKSNHYCMWLCPLGSCQELIGMISPWSIKMSQKTVKHLTFFREMLWIAIMAVMWLGIGFECLDYELFSVFMFKQASVPLFIAAIAFIGLSTVIQRPYCRFVCPTGSLIKYAQQIKSNPKIQKK